MITRLKNLWRLSKMEQASDINREITLKLPENQPRPKKKLATIVEMEKVEMFPKEPNKVL